MLNSEKMNGDNFVTFGCGIYHTPQFFSNFAHTKYSFYALYT
ncbi:hypothetical protein NJ75_02671 [Novosphingobium subterraneum]|uniref:Uncharacterized protein n=1 Tax=Novosphingobium subterraneum TaxID=48936 RepID=A0A0B9A8I8_9SPHN|nr:hypothetical protein NJ75_02671 [Novosphingobium subterraneum]